MCCKSKIGIVKKLLGEVYYEGEQESYIRILPYEEAAYLHVAYVGMDVVIVGEEDNYYQVLTKEGFLGYIQRKMCDRCYFAFSKRESVFVQTVSRHTI